MKREINQLLLGIAKLALLALTFLTPSCSGGLPLDRECDRLLALAEEAGDALTRYKSEKGAWPTTLSEVANLPEEVLLGWRFRKLRDDLGVEVSIGDYSKAGWTILWDSVNGTQFNH